MNRTIAVAASEMRQDYVRRMIEEDRRAIRSGFSTNLIREANTAAWYEEAERFYQRAYDEYWDWGYDVPAENFTTFSVRELWEQVEVMYHDYEAEPEAEPEPDIERLNGSWPMLPRVINRCGECDWECSICLESKPEQQCVETACHHKFHKECLYGMTKTKTPFCRIWNIGIGVPEMRYTESASNMLCGVCEPTNATWYVNCPLCRAKITLDKGAGEEEFNGWAACQCCPRHLSRRPPSYAPWAGPPPQHPEYRPDPNPFCQCYCRTRMRDLVRVLW